MNQWSKNMLVISNICKYIANILKKKKKKLMLKHI